MKMNTGFDFRANVRTLFSENAVILCNRDTGRWMKISQQCYDTLKLGIANSLSPNELLRRLFDEEDREYFSVLMKKIDELGVLKNEADIEPIPVMRNVDFAITHRCNLKCIHCCVNAQTVSDKDILTSDDLNQIVDKIIVLNPVGINFTGGEPLIRNDFINLLDYTFRHYSGKIGIMTNGTLINENTAHFLADRLTKIDISIDGIDEVTCSKIRGKGVFTKVMNSIKLLQDAGLENITLSMVMTKYTHNLKNQFDELNRQLGTRGIIRKFSPIGRGEINKDILKDERTSHDNSGDNMVSEMASLNSIKTCRCGALNKTLYINYEGDIYPCGLLEKSEYYLGNMKDIESLSDFLSSDKFKTCQGYKSYLALQPENHDRCKDCNVNQFCWNCIHFLDLISKNDDFFNQACPIIKKDLQKLIWSERR